jgi:hypothetical protein
MDGEADLAQHLERLLRESSERYDDAPPYNDHMGQDPAFLPSSSSDPSPSKEPIKRARRKYIFMEPTLEEVRSLKTKPLLDLIRERPSYLDKLATRKWDKLFDLHPDIIKWDTTNLKAKDFEVAFRQVRGIDLRTNLPTDDYDPDVQRSLTFAMKRNLLKVRRASAVYVETFLSEWRMFQQALQSKVRYTMRKYKLEDATREGDDQEEEKEEHKQKQVQPRKTYTRKRTDKVREESVRLQVALHFSKKQKQIKDVVERLRNANLDHAIDTVAMEKSIGRVVGKEDEEVDQETISAAVTRFLEEEGRHSSDYAEEVNMLRASKRRKEHSRSRKQASKLKKAQDSREHAGPEFVQIGTCAPP